VILVYLNMKSQFYANITMNKDSLLHLPYYQNVA
jgi:hypothetical protein